jgi:hypothetical protein
MVRFLRSSGIDASMGAYIVEGPKMGKKERTAMYLSHPHKRFRMRLQALLPAAVGLALLAAPVTVRAQAVVMAGSY